MSNTTLSQPPAVGRANPAGSAIDPGAEGHDPGLYATALLAPKLNGFGSITREHEDFYHQEGYLAVENAFTASETEAASRGLLDLILGRNPQFTGISFEAVAATRLETLSVDELQDAVRKLMGFVDYDERLRAIAMHPGLMQVVERLLGEPACLIQDMALIKPPHFGREKPWHQDKAYFNYPVATRVVGVWIALDEATVANGCMHVRPQGHHAGPIIHFKRRDWQICDSDVVGHPCVAVPLRPGGALFFDGLLPHGSPTNHSPHRRKALQFHYAGVSASKTTEQERLAVFGSEGKNVEC